MWIILLAATPLRLSAAVTAGRYPTSVLLRREETPSSAAVDGAAALSVHKISGASLLADQLPKARVQSCTPGNDWKHRSCKLSNLCYDMRVNRFLWNAGTPRAIGNISKDVQVLADLTPACGELFSMTAGGTFKQDEIHCLDLHPVIPGQATANDSKLAIFHGVTALVARRHAPSNAGHFLMQTATALERLANDYGITSAAARIVVFADACATIKEPDPAPPFRNELCQQFTREFASPLSLHNLIELPDLRNASFLGNRLADFDYLCFSDALGGIGGHSPYDGNSWSEMARWVSPYREKVYAHYLFEASSRSHKGCNIVFARKEGFHGFKPVANQDEIDKTLSKWAYEHKLVYESMTLRNVSFQEQLLALQHADILVAVPGSTAFSAFFLEPGTEMIYLAEDNYESSILKLSSEYRTHFITQVPPKPGSDEEKLVNTYDYGANVPQELPGLIAPEALTASLERIVAQRGC